MSRAPRPGSRRRAALAAALICLGGLVLAAGLVALYARSQVLDGHRFAERAAGTADSAAVQAALARAVAKDIVEEARPDAIVARPIIESVVAGVVASDAFRPLLRGAARELYGALVAGSGGGVVLGLSDAVVVAMEALRRFEPEVAAQIPDEVDRAAVRLAEGDVGAGLLGHAATVRRLGLALPAAGGALLLAGIAGAARRRRAAGWAGISVAAAGAAVALAVPIGRELLTAGLAAEHRDVGRAVWGAFVDDLQTWGLAATGIGMAVWLVARGHLDAVAVGDGARRALGWALAPPRGRRDATLRGALLVAAGALLITSWQTALRIAVVGAGALVAVRGLTLLLHALAPRRPAAPVPAAGRLVRARPALPVVVGSVAAAVIAAGVVLGVRGAPTYGAEAVTACNGARELCERPVDEVAFAATHNSMSAADEPGWLLAEHTGGIRAQLEFGIRGFLIDTWYGIPGPRGVSTDFWRSGVDRADLVAEYGAATVAAVERLRGRLGFGPRDGERAVFLCHVACEIGATPAVDALREIADFLRRNPGEVVILVLQDQVTPEDTRRAIVRAGLRELVHTPVPGAPWPTLGEMVDSGERVIVMSEDRTSPDIPWLLPAFEVMEETPFRNPSVEAMGCAPNRGGTGKPFFQLNHWVDEPVPSVANARRANARDALLGRARRCAEERGRIPNLVAVNFYEEGDLLDVVAELNGFPAGGAP